MVSPYESEVELFSFHLGLSSSIPTAIVHIMHRIARLFLADDNDLFFSSRFHSSV